jgi:hypothetical protein
MLGEYHTLNMFLNKTLSARMWVPDVEGQGAQCKRKNVFIGRGSECLL